MEPVALHLGTLIMTALVIVVTDIRAVRYFMGYEDLLPRAFVIFAHRAVWIGLLCMIASGVYLTIPYYEHYLADVYFRLKMAFVGILVVNAVAISSLAGIASERPFLLLTPQQKMKLCISGATSFLCWVGATVLGFWYI
jgi:hypothetical protein